ncbi:hypothetical protein [Streptomyces niveus]|uniref:hypothetical protein n=1 Tax=Streptomyces niveus TaxID=193462 RepID=UPI00343BEE76
MSAPNSVSSAVGSAHAISGARSRGAGQHEAVIGCGDLAGVLEPGDGFLAGAAVGGVGRSVVSGGRPGRGYLPL